MSRNPAADSLISFLNESPTPYHAVETAARHLGDAGIFPAAEGENLNLKPGEGAFVIRGGSSLVAVRVPEDFSEKNPKPFHIVAAHTDSPGLRLKPKPADPVFQYRQWGVEIYGGALYNSWLDRDLGVAGRIFQARTGAQSGTLLRLEDAPVRIPQLAIHLDRAVNEGLVLNPQKHLLPVMGQIGGPALETILEVAAGAPFAELTFDLCLYDVQPARYGGLGDAFIYGARLDNLAMCHAGLSAFLAAPAQNTVQVLALFDHEEVGSVSAQGAESSFLPSVLERVGLALGLNRETWLALLPQSFLISADMAHALHPNYPEKHEPSHFPLPNRGVVLKANAGLRYASDGASSARFLGFAHRAEVPVQNFLSRADLGCGTTVGPGLCAHLGIPGVDAGTPMLSMHSAREMCGSEDQGYMIALLGEFFRG